jgi:hypothetical protein
MVLAVFGVGASIRSCVQILKTFLSSLEKKRIYQKLFLQVCFFRDLLNNIKSWYMYHDGVLSCVIILFVDSYISDIDRS